MQTTCLNPLRLGLTLSGRAVLIADDQALVRTGFRKILESESDLEVVGEAGDGGEAVEASLLLRPDVVLMGIRMPRLDGLGPHPHLRAGLPVAGAAQERPSKSRLPNWGAVRGSTRFHAPLPRHALQEVIEGSSRASCRNPRLDGGFGGHDPQVTGAGWRC